jgi:hypothetical protein
LLLLYVIVFAGSVGVRMWQGLTVGYNSNFLAEGAKFAGASFVTIRASNVAGC